MDHLEDFPSLQDVPGDSLGGGLAEIEKDAEVRQAMESIFSLIDEKEDIWVPYKLACSVPVAAESTEKKTGVPKTWAGGNGSFGFDSGLRTGGMEPALSSQVFF